MPVASRRTRWRRCASSQVSTQLPERRTPPSIESPQASVRDPCRTRRAAQAPASTAAPSQPSHRHRARSDHGRPRSQRDRLARAASASAAQRIPSSTDWRRSFSTPSSFAARGRRKASAARTRSASHSAGTRADDATHEERRKHARQLVEVTLDPGVHDVARRAPQAERREQVAEILRLDRAVEHEAERRARSAPDRRTRSARRARARAPRASAGGSTTVQQAVEQRGVAALGRERQRDARQIRVGVRASRCESSQARASPPPPPPAWGRPPRDRRARAGSPRA